MYKTGVSGEKHTLEIPEGGFAVDLVEDDDESSQHRGARRTPPHTPQFQSQSAARHAAFQTQNSRETAVEKRLSPRGLSPKGLSPRGLSPRGPSTPRSGRALKSPRDGPKHPSKDNPSLARHMGLEEGVLFGEEIVSRISLMSPDGALCGLYASAQEAVDAAAAGCTICLPMGVFEGNLVIRKPLRIVSCEHYGSKSPQQPRESSSSHRDASASLWPVSSLISSSDLPALTVRSKGVSLVGVALQQSIYHPRSHPIRGGAGRGRESARGSRDSGRGREDERAALEEEEEVAAAAHQAMSERSALLVTNGGEISMEHCLVQNLHGVCMRVSGAAASATARMCKFADGAAGGIRFEDGGGGLLSECDVCSNRQFGILVTTGSAPDISACKIHDGAAEGVIFCEAGGRMSDCDIFHNTGVGVCIAQGADPLIEKCRFFKGLSCGLLVQDGGKGVLRNSQLCCHFGAEVEVRSDGKPSLVENRMHDSKGCGILVDSAGGVFQRNEICGNARAGIRLQGGASGLFTHNRVCAGAQSGIVVETLSAGTFESNIVILNGQCGVELRDDAAATLKLNVISRNGHMGLLVYNGAGGLIQGNDIKNNGASGIACMLNAEPRIIGNHIHSNMHHGLLFNHGGKGLVQGNHIYGNMRVGIRIESQADPLVVRNSIFNGFHHGVAVCDGGRGTLQGNTILRNRSTGIKIRSEGSPIVVGNCVHDGLCIGIHVAHTGFGEIRLNSIYKNRGRDLHVEAPPNQIALVANGDSSIENDSEFQKYFFWDNSSGDFDATEVEGLGEVKAHG